MDKIAKGWSIKVTGLTEQFDWIQYQQHFDEGYIALFVLTKNEKLVIFDSTDKHLEPAAGDQVMSLVAPETTSAESQEKNQNPDPHVP
ncbi:hypothetical protein [Acidithiobacillus marinus]|uniref:hypothetical protein n=1 Tax=Acidithiobacillus marinus TaxID=187490 RepID=UPI00117BB031|nr:hypothetical protein [Acidithiobacillus marinus]